MYGNEAWVVTLLCLFLQKLIPLPFFITGVDAHIAVRDSLTSKYEAEQVNKNMYVCMYACVYVCMCGRTYRCQGLIDSHA